ncbi:hypothetical protein DPMN_091412 [Dreissena polymorpha]|uniref:Uncharacterized protein n=1 Tax=Dreissena polymorpha TaxID=45954 RepID=A0A9D4L1K1_DREPO|nr:hypothetical protein DPMN_091412 [Dreissena polymorpha]
MLIERIPECELGHAKGTSEGLLLGVCYHVFKQRVAIGDHLTADGTPVPVLIKHGFVGVNCSFWCVLRVQGTSVLRG